jgi:Na+/proline symporter
MHVRQGGMKAVICTDALQAGVMFTGLVVVAVQGTAEAGGFDNVWAVNARDGRIADFECVGMCVRTCECSWSLNPFTRMTSLGIIIGQCVSWLGWYGINQSAVQR